MITMEVVGRKWAGTCLLLAAVALGIVPVVVGPLGVLAGMVAVAKGMCGGDVPASRGALWRR